MRYVVSSCDGVHTIVVVFKPLLAVLVLSRQQIVAMAT